MALNQNSDNKNVPVIVIDDSAMTSDLVSLSKQLKQMESRTEAINSTLLNDNNILRDKNSILSASMLFKLSSLNYFCCLLSE